MAEFGERIEVDLVEIDVWVVDPRGRPVQGLTAADFAVRHDGRPVPVTHFREVRGGEERQAVAEPGSDTVVPPPAAEPPGHLVLYVDQLRLQPGSFQRLSDAVVELLGAGVVPPERIMILRQDEAVHVEAPFGSSRAELEAAVARIRGSAHVGMDTTRELLDAREAIEDLWEESSGLVGRAAGGLGGVPGEGPGSTNSPRQTLGGGSGSFGPTACDVFRQRVGSVAAGWAHHRSRRLSVTLANLESTAALLAGLPGLKTLVYVSDGLDVEPGASLAAFVGSFCPGQPGEQALESLAEELSRGFGALTRHLNTHRVTLHAIQASGLRGGGPGSAAVRARRGGGGRVLESRQRQSDVDGLFLISGPTGGRTVIGQGAVGDELTAIAQAMGNYYSLAYELPEGDREPHRVEIALSDRTLETRHRQSFASHSPDVTVSERLAAALSLGITSNPLDVRLAAAERPSGDSSLRLYAMVPVDRLSFLPEGDDELATVEVKVIVRSSGSRELRETAQTFRVRRTRDTDERAALPIDLDLGAGAHTVAVAVRDVSSGSSSFVTTALEIDAPASGSRR